MGEPRVERWNIDHPQWRYAWPEEFAELLRERKRREDNGLTTGAAAERYWLERIQRRRQSGSGEIVAANADNDALA